MHANTIRQKAPKKRRTVRIRFVEKLVRPSRSSILAPTYKFGYVDTSGAELPYQYGDVWAIQKTTGPDRLAIAPSSRPIDLLLELAAVMNEPYGLLYVLQVPRNDTYPAGRYQSPEPISRGELGTFLRKFGTLLESDGRHHFWIMTIDKSAMLVYDRHNVFYAYGPLATFEGVLLRNNLQQADEVSFPDPHVHHYNAEFDEQALQLMNYWSWLKYPLQDSDM